VEVLDEGLVEGGGGEVLGLVGVGGEVVEPGGVVIDVEVLPVGVAGGADAFGFGDDGVVEEVFVEEIGSPGGGLRLEEGGEGAALHLGGWG